MSLWDLTQCAVTQEKKNYQTEIHILNMT